MQTSTFQGQHPRLITTLYPHENVLRLELYLNPRSLSLDPPKLGWQDCCASVPGTCGTFYAKLGFSIGSIQHRAETDQLPLWPQDNKIFVVDGSGVQESRGTSDRA
jgi:hypothetical protein